MATEKVEKRVEVFFSYHEQDEKLRQALDKHLSSLKRQAFISTWHFRKLHAGMEQVKEISAHLNSAHIILLLVSPDYIDSDYCYEIEVKRAMERHEAGEAIVIPIILRPVIWQGTPFGKLRPSPIEGRAVTLYRNRDQAFVDICVDIQTAVEKIRNNREERPEKIHRYYQYDIVLSYASEDSSYAETLAHFLHLKGMKILCYSQEMSKEIKFPLEVENPLSYLFGPYQEKSYYYVVFLSQNYAAKMRTHELELTFSYTLKDLITICLDSTNFIGPGECLWWEKMAVENITNLLVEKVKEVKRITPYDY